MKPDIRSESEMFARIADAIHSSWGPLDEAFHAKDPLSPIWMCLVQIIGVPVINTILIRKIRGPKNERGNYPLNFLTL